MGRNLVNDIGSENRKFAGCDQIFTNLYISSHENCLKNDSEYYKCESNDKFSQQSLTNREFKLLEVHVKISAACIWQKHCCILFCCSILCNYDVLIICRCIYVWYWVRSCYTHGYVCMDMYVFMVKWWIMTMDMYSWLNDKLWL